MNTPEHRHVHRCLTCHRVPWVCHEPACRGKSYVRGCERCRPQIPEVPEGLGEAARGEAQ